MYSDCRQTYDSEQILLSRKRFRIQLNNVIRSNINMLEQIHAPNLNLRVIQFRPDLLYESQYHSLVL